MFKVFPKQIPVKQIDSTLSQHYHFKNNPFSFFRAQGTTKFELPLLNEYGNQLNSIHNPHLLGFSKKFSSEVEKIITHNNISKCLTLFTGSNEHVLYQSMFFDNSTGTKLHQDTWYLDTIPNGKLIGVWIALEDIEYSAGPFCIYTNSDKKKLKPNDYNFNDLENDPKFRNDYPSAKRYDFTARKGDVLIWDSFTIHGALLPTDQSITRKSITAHFYPSNLLTQAPPISRFFTIYNHKKPIKTSNPTILKATTINTFLYQTICTVLFFLEKIKPFKVFLMRESNDRISNIRRIKK